MIMLPVQQMSVILCFLFVCYGVSVSETGFLVIVSLSPNWAVGLITLEESHLHVSKLLKTLS